MSAQGLLCGFHVHGYLLVIFHISPLPGIGVKDIDDGFY